MRCALGFQGLAICLGLTFARPVVASPTAPSDLHVTAASQSVAFLEWTDQREPGTVYWVERKTLNGDFVNSGTVGVGSGPARFLDPGTTYVFRIRAEDSAGNVAYSNLAFGTTDIPSRPCQSSSESMCLQDQRFELRANWRIGQGPYVPGHAVALTSDTGYFWFFDPANVEMVVKVLRGCGVNGYYWVYSGGLTDVEVVWTVQDTGIGQFATYANPPGKAFVPVQDIFAHGCP